jgi:biofilm PGA synthesis protein PgaD
MSPRQHPVHPEIIYRPDLQPRSRRVMFSGITLLAWFVWFYLFVPLMSLGAWWFGIDAFQQYMLQPGARGYLLTLTGYAIVVALTFLVIFGWSRYNQLRFGGPDRRMGQPPVTTEMTARRFSVRPELLEQLQAARTIDLNFDPTGKLAHPTIRQTSPASRASMK